MYYLLLTLLILDAILMSTVVLLQSGKGGGLAAMGAAGTGSDSLFGGRQAATILTKMTWWTGGIFLVLAFILSLMSSQPATSGSILRGTSPAVPTATEPVAPGLLDAPAEQGAAGGADPADAAPATQPEG